jgi:hypothetical protein
MIVPPAGVRVLRLARMRAALLGPLKEVHGVSDKILMMTLSILFLSMIVPLPTGPGPRHLQRL